MSECRIYFASEAFSAAGKTLETVLEEYPKVLKDSERKKIELFTKRAHEAAGYLRNMTRRRILNHREDAT